MSETFDTVLKRELVNDDPKIKKRTYSNICCYTTSLGHIYRIKGDTASAT